MTGGRFHAMKVDRESHDLVPCILTTAFPRSSNLPLSSPHLAMGGPIPTPPPISSSSYTSIIVLVAQVIGKVLGERMAVAIYHIFTPPSTATGVFGLVDT